MYIDYKFQSAKLHFDLFEMTTVAVTFAVSDQIEDVKVNSMETISFRIAPSCKKNLKLEMHNYLL